MRFTIFYSWQSDLDKKTNHFFIRDSLRAAIERLQGNPDTDLELRLDSDTKDTSGAPDIAQTIFDKIEKCQIFVCDISIINPESQKRKTPNPNVLLELGYAIRRLSWERVICVFNGTTGNLPNDLPFDLRQHRITHYRFSRDPNEKQVAQKQLEETLLFAIKQILENNPPILTDTLTERNRIERQRDIQTLGSFFERINTVALDYLFEEGRQGFIHDEVLFEEENIRLYLNSSRFHLYDKKLREKIDKFYKALRYSLGFGNYIHSTNNPLIDRFEIKSSVDEIVFANFIKAIRRAELAFKDLMTYVQSSFHEIDVKETNVVAAATYSEHSKEYISAPRKKAKKRVKVKTRDS